MKIFLQYFFRLWPARKLLGERRVYLPGLSDTQYSLLFQRSVLKHALATPLTTLIGTIELCQSDPQFIQKPSTVRRLQTATQRLSSILEEWVHTAEGNKTEFSVAESIREIITLLHKRQQTQYVTFQNGVRSECTVRGSRLLFQEAITCLISNALESYDPRDAYKLVVVAAKLHKDQLRIDIIDFGSGMNVFAQGLAHVRGISFKPNGSGVGLYFTKRVIEQLFAGLFLIQSSAGNGTRASISLPLAGHVPKPSNSLDY